MVDSHESDAFGPYFEKVRFLNIKNKQRFYITHSEARHLHLINRQHFFCFCKFKVRKSILHNINILHIISMT